MTVPGAKAPSLFLPLRRQAFRAEHSTERQWTLHHSPIRLRRKRALTLLVGREMEKREADVSALETPVCLPKV